MFPRAKDNWVPRAVETSSAWQSKQSSSKEPDSEDSQKPKAATTPWDNIPPPKRPKFALESGFQWPTSSSSASEKLANNECKAEAQDATARTEIEAGETNEKKEAGTVKEATTAAEKRDEIIEASPRLAEHLRSGGIAKFNKVTAMASSLLESGRVSAYNSGAFYEVLEAAVSSHASKIRGKDTRAAFRSLFGAALSKQDVFSQKHQAMLRVWQMRVVNQIDLLTLGDQFQRIAKELRLGMLMLPCISPALEPPTRSGAPREHMPESARRMWADAIFECLEVAHERYNKKEWAQSEVNMLVKSAHDRRQNFTEDQNKKLQSWELERRDSARLDSSGFKPATK